MIIEDDPTTIQLIESQLTSAGYEAHSYSQPDQALEKAAALQPRAITLDLLMKPTSGWEILLQLKSDIRTKNIPVIVVTIVDRPSAGGALGADEYLVKPVDKNRLLATQTLLALAKSCRPFPDAKGKWGLSSSSRLSLRSWPGRKRATSPITCSLFIQRRSGDAGEYDLHKAHRG